MLKKILCSIFGHQSVPTYSAEAQDTIKVCKRCGFRSRYPLPLFLHPKPIISRAEVVEVKPGDVIVLRHPNRLSAEAIACIQKSWNELYKGAEHKPLKIIVLEEGMDVCVLRYDPVTLTEEDKSFVEAKEFSRDEIRRAAGLTEAEVHRVRRAQGLSKVPPRQNDPYLG